MSALLKRPAAVSKKLLLWHEVLVLINLSLFPESSAWKKVCLPQYPEGVHNLKGQQIAVDHAYTTVDDMLQSALVPDSYTGKPGVDEGGEDGSSDGIIEVHQCWLLDHLFVPLVIVFGLCKLLHLLVDCWLTVPTNHFWKCRWCGDFSFCFSLGVTQLLSI